MSVCVLCELSPLLDSTLSCCIDGGLPACGSECVLACVCVCVFACVSLSLSLSLARDLLLVAVTKSSLSRAA